MREYVSRSETLANLARDARHAAARARNGLEYLAATPPSSIGQTPKDLVWQRDKVRLWRYRFESPRFHPPVLVFLGLVSRSYVFDLQPRSSFVRTLGDAGFDVYLLDWGAADQADADNTLETYVDFYFPRALDAVARDSGSPGVNLLAYCMGAMLAFLFAGTRAETQIRALVTLAAPVEFSKMGVLMGPLRDGSLDPDTVIDSFGLVPGEVVRRFFSVRRPTADLVQYVNLWEKLGNEQDVAGHTAMAQWVRDQIALPGALFRQLTTMFMRDDGFMNQRARLGGRRVDLSRVAMPILSVTAERDDIVPAASTRPLASLVGGEVTDVVVPSGHVSLVMGRHAAKTTLPAITAWLADHSEPFVGGRP